MPDVGIADLISQAKETAVAEKKKIYRCAYALCTNREEAEELAFEAYKKFFSRIEDMSADRLAELKVLAYIKEIVRNEVYDRQASRKRAPVSLDAHTVLDPTTDTLADAGVITREERRLLERHLEALPAEMRTAVCMRYLGGKSYSEMAAATGRNISTLRSDVHRGLKILKDKWFEK